ncbi:MAG TPA: DUF2203 domain-containing protein [Phycisphaerae bacterium]|nr:DUF2203 domain-containing protein [Phycisphaerae bacterium]
MTQFSSTIKTTSTPRQGKKYFTLDEASRALPLVKRIAADIQRTQAQRLRIHAELSVGLSDLSPRRQADLQSDFDRATDRLESLIEELTQIGVDLKDPSRALLDFPCLHEGREVLLCWKADEETITHWHEVDGGFAGRKPVCHLHH